ncbi:M14 family zinc carboxypeptidase [Micromonospora sp. M12]
MPPRSRSCSAWFPCSAAPPTRAPPDRPLQQRPDRAVEHRAQPGERARFPARRGAGAGRHQRRGPDVPGHRRRRLGPGRHRSADHQRARPTAAVRGGVHRTPRPARRAARDRRRRTRPARPRRTSARTAARTAKDSPAIVWVTANVHGGEKSGTDAALKTLYELAAGLSCEVARRNDNLVTIIVPTQNPDGRDATRRQNEFGFDLNRDWFARTQQETDGKLELLRRYPPQVFIDAHEMGGRQYFFPPNADPIHHEIAGEAVDWINRIGEANKAGFGFNGACDEAVTTECYFNYDTYDMFFMGYGDAVPTTGFGAAGMTYEGQRVGRGRPGPAAVPHPVVDARLGRGEQA